MPGQLHKPSDQLLQTDRNARADIEGSGDVWPFNER
jgi:hypothetical protein